MIHEDNTVHKLVWEKAKDKGGIKFLMMVILDEGDKETNTSLEKALTKANYGKFK